MSSENIVERAVGDARRLHQSVSDAVGRAAFEMKPKIQDSIEQAERMQQTLTEHAAESAKISADGQKAMLGHLASIVQMGRAAIKESADQARHTAEKMVDETRALYETASGIAGFNPNTAFEGEDGPPKRTML